MRATAYNGDEVHCPLAMASAESWSFVRAVTVDVAERAALLGYACDRVGEWQISGQRVALGQWPPGRAQLVLTLVCSEQLVRQWSDSVTLDGSIQ